MNPALNSLHAYPFEKLRALFASVTPPTDLSAISLGIGEPRHPTPQLIRDALAAASDQLAYYPSTIGSDELRQALASWLQQRHGLPALNVATQVLPVSGSREALFALAQTFVGPDAVVICPNPFYQIYEGAALLAGAQPYYLNADAAHGFACDYQTVPEAVWQKTQLVYVCSPANPSGAVMDLAQWQYLFTMSARYGFLIVSDECYSEIYFDEVAPPLGALAAAAQLGLSDYARLIVCGSLSKRSNVPGLRSGFVAGDANSVATFTRYRTYHGCALGGTVQKASIAAWQDEAHVRHNRQLYREKFAAIWPLLAVYLDVQMPQAGFYLWARVDQRTGMSDTEFARALYQATAVTVLPGSYLARADDRGINPGQGYVRMALVAQAAQSIEAAQRICQWLAAQQNKSQQ